MPDIIFHHDIEHEVKASFQQPWSINSAHQPEWFKVLTFNFKASVIIYPIPFSIRHSCIGVIYSKSNNLGVNNGHTQACSTVSNL